MSGPTDTGRFRAFAARTGRWYFHWTTAVIGIVIGLCAVLFTGVPLLGRVAWADETDRRIDAKVAVAVGSFQTTVGEIKTQMRDQNELLMEQVIASLGSNICRYNVRRNKEPDIEERLRITNQINEMRSKFAKFTGYEFNMTDC